MGLSRLGRRAILLAVVLLGVFPALADKDAEGYDPAALQQLLTTRTARPGADLKGANLQGANLLGANLAGADFSYATMPDGSRHR